MTARRIFGVTLAVSLILLLTGVGLLIAAVNTGQRCGNAPSPAVTAAAAYLIEGTIVEIPSEVPPLAQAAWWLWQRAEEWLSGSFG